MLKKKERKYHEEAITSCITVTTNLFYFGLEPLELFHQCCHQSRFKRFNGSVTVWTAINSYGYNRPQRRRTAVKAIPQLSAFCRVITSQVSERLKNRYSCKSLWLHVSLCVCLREGVAVNWTRNFLLPTSSANHTFPHCCLFHA